MQQQLRGTLWKNKTDLMVLEKRLHGCLNAQVYKPEMERKQCIHYTAYIPFGQIGKVHMIEFEQLFS